MTTVSLFGWIEQRAIRWLDRRGHHVVRRGAVEMVLSGYFVAFRENNGCFRVCPPPHFLLVALNHTIVDGTDGILMSASSEGGGFKSERS